MVLSRKFQANFWSQQKNKIDSYWNTTVGIERSMWFANYLKQFVFNTICEFGMCVGRNLFYIDKEIKNIEISGFDINKDAVDFAKTKVSNGNFYVSDIYDFCNNDKFDITFTMGVLVHLIPEDLPKIVENMIKHSNKYIINMEEIGNNEIVKQPTRKNTYKFAQYKPDIISVHKNLGLSPEIIKIPDNLCSSGAKQLIISKI